MGKDNNLKKYDNKEFLEYLKEVNEDIDTKIFYKELESIENERKVKKK